MLAPAQTMRQLWVSMPDSIVPYLTESNRTELADYVDMQMEAVIQNQLKDTTRMRVLKSSYIDVELSAASRLQMKLLPWSGAETDTLLCVVTTLRGPAAASRIVFYDRRWQPVAVESPLSTVDASTFVVRPDSLSDATYEELLALLRPVMVALELSPADDGLIIRASLPPMTRDEKARLEPFLVQRKLKWNGRKFN